MLSRARCGPRARPRLRGSRSDNITMRYKAPVLGVVFIGIVAVRLWHVGSNAESPAPREGDAPQTEAGASVAPERAAVAPSAEAASDATAAHEPSALRAPLPGEAPATPMAQA